MMVCVSMTGAMMRNTCGSTTCSVTCQGRSPIARPARLWPRAMEAMPARTISEKYAASNTMKVISAEGKAPTCTGRRAPVSHCARYGTRKKNQKITSTSGSERTRFT